MLLILKFDFDFDAFNYVYLFGKRKFRKESKLTISTDAYACLHPKAIRTPRRVWHLCACQCHEQMLRFHSGHIPQTKSSPFSWYWNTERLRWHYNAEERDRDIAAAHINAARMRDDDDDVDAWQGRAGEREPNEMKWNRIDKDFCWLADVPFYYARLARIDKASLAVGAGDQAAQSIIVAAQWSDKLNKKLAINWCKLISFYIDIFIEFALCMRWVQLRVQWKLNYCMGNYTLRHAT